MSAVRMNYYWMTTTETEGRISDLFYTPGPISRKHNKGGISWTCTITRTSRKTMTGILK